MGEGISIPWGRTDRLRLEIPPAWRLVAHDQTQAPKPIADLAGAIRAILDAPHGLPPLAKLVSPHTRFASN